MSRQGRARPFDAGIQPSAGSKLSLVGQSDLEVLALVIAAAVLAAHAGSLALLLLRCGRGFSFWRFAGVRRRSWPTKLVVCQFDI